MKRSYLMFLAHLILFNSLVLSCSIRDVIDRRLDTKLTEKSLTSVQIQEDVGYYLKMNERISPFPYLNVRKSSIDSIANATQYNTTVSALEFYKKFQVLQAAFNVPHMYSRFPIEQYSDYTNKNGAFPLWCEVDDDGFFVKSSFVPLNDYGIRVGDRLIAINGVNSDMLALKYCQYIGGSLTYKRRGVRNYLSRFLWLDSIHAPYVLELSNKHGVEYSVRMDGYGLSGNTTSSAKKLWGYEVLNDSFAVIRVNSFAITDEAGYLDFLNESFKDLSERDTRDLILDISLNDGGTSRHAISLLNYFTENPYKLVGDKKWLVSQEFKENYKDMFPWYVRSLAIKSTNMNEYMRAKDGEYFGTDSSKFIVPKDVTYKFKGSVHVLIGMGTFSTAMNMADAVVEHNLASVWGQPTGSCPNELGEIVFVRLPNSGISCALPSALFTRVSGDIHNLLPVLPEFAIPEDCLGACAYEFIMNKRKTIKVKG
jgi:hypothetical protein